MENKNLVASKNSVAVSFAAFIIIIAGMMYASAIVIPLLMALFISIICAQPILWLQNKKVPQGLAVTMVFILIIVIFIGFGELIAQSLSSFSNNAATYEKNLDEMGNSVLQYLKDKGVNIETENMSKIFAPSKIMGLTATLLGTFGGLMGNTFTIFFLALFLLMELEDISLKIKAILKDSTVSLKYFNVIGDSIRHYLSIKTVISLLTGVLIWIGLAIIGVDYAIIWGLIAFLLNYIPNIGSILAGIPAILFALIQLGFDGALWTTVLFVAINMVIGNAIEPRMMGKGLGLSTFVVFLSLIFWGFIFGTVGMFLSVPLTMAIKIILEQHPKTKWIAILLGTQEDAQAVLEENNP